MFNKSITKLPANNSRTGRFPRAVSTHNCRDCKKLVRHKATIAFSDSFVVVVVEVTVVLSGGNILDFLYNYK